MRTATPLTRQRGLAIVETAITLPFLLFVMLAAIEFTNAFVTHTTLTKAVRDGARWAAEEAIGGGDTIVWSTALEKEVQNLVVYGNRGGTGTPVVKGLDTQEGKGKNKKFKYVKVERVGTSDNIRVWVENYPYYPYASIFGSVLPSFGYGSNISTLFNLSATVTMRAL